MKTFLSLWKRDSTGRSSIEQIVLKVEQRLLEEKQKELLVLVDQNMERGTYEIEFNANELPSGVYYYRIQAGNFSNTKKMILLK